MLSLPGRARTHGISIILGWQLLALLIFGRQVLLGVPGGHRPVVQQPLLVTILKTILYIRTELNFDIFVLLTIPNW